MYRRNADDTVRNTLRQWANHSISAEDLISILQRYNFPVELARIFEQKNKLDIQIALDIGTSDSFFAPWDLDQSLVSATSMVLARVAAPGSEGEFDFTPISKEEIFSLVPGLASVLELNHLLPLVSKFIVSQLDYRPILIICFGLLDDIIPQIVPTSEKIAQAMVRWTRLEKFFGPSVPMDIWYKGGLLRRNEVQIALRNTLGFTAVVTTDKDLLEKIPSYPNLTLLGHSLENLQLYCWHVVKKWATAVHWATALSQNKVEQISVGFGVLPLQPLLIKRYKLGSQAMMLGDNLTETYTTSQTAVEQPLELVTLFFCIDYAVDYPSPEDPSICFMLERGQVRDTLVTDDLREFPVTISTPASHQSRKEWLQHAAKALAANWHPQMDIVWLD